MMDDRSYPRPTTLLQPNQGRLNVDRLNRLPRSIRRFAPPAGILSLLAIAAPASAHVPWFNDGSPDPEQPYRLQTEIDVSQVVYAGFDDGGQVDYYAFTAPSGFDLDMYLVTSSDPACVAFRPAFALIGPGLPGSVSNPARPPALTPSMTQALPAPAAIPVPGEAAAPGPDAGVVLVAGEEWGTLYEEFGGITFNTGPRLEERLAGGEYLVAVFDPADGTGAYGLTIDGAEIFPEAFDAATFEAKFTPWNGCEPEALAVALAEATPAPR
ncbi:MAG TPA: hypothetical protein VER37_07780 [Thermomicrobiales bacterium]|nr:hypothetical protein [Thermomicrobiales bacterium]